MTRIFTWYKDSTRDVGPMGPTQWVAYSSPQPQDRIWYPNPPPFLGCTFLGGEVGGNLCWSHNLNVGSGTSLLSITMHTWPRLGFFPCSSSCSSMASQSLAQTPWSYLNVINLTRTSWRASASHNIQWTSRKVSTMSVSISGLLFSRISLMQQVRPSPMKLSRVGHNPTGTIHTNGRTSLTLPKNRGIAGRNTFRPTSSALPETTSKSRLVSGHKPEGLCYHVKALLQTRICHQTTMSGYFWCIIWLRIWRCMTSYSQISQPMGASHTTTCCYKSWAGPKKNIYVLSLMGELHKTKQDMVETYHHSVDENMQLDTSLMFDTIKAEERHCLSP